MLQRKKKNKTIIEKLYYELLDASQNKGSAIKKREDTHKMAEFNKALRTLGGNVWRINTL